jgi:DNA-binding transcriptional ArsR family regulator
VVRDPIQAATALARLQNTQTRFRELQEERRRAILDAVDAEVTLREVAEAADVSHETVRRLVAADGQVVVELDGVAYRLTGRQVEVQIYKLSGLAQGAFPGEIERLGVDKEWLPDAAKLAHELQAAMADESGAQVKLDKRTGWALFLALCGTYSDGLSVFGQLRAALQDRYPDRAQQVFASMQGQARPRKL